MRNSSKKNNKIFEYYKNIFKEIFIKIFKNRILYILGFVFILFLITTFDSLIYSFELLFNLLIKLFTTQKENMEFVYYTGSHISFFIFFFICGNIIFILLLVYALKDKEIRKEIISNIFNLKKIFQNIFNIIIIFFCFIFLIIAFFSTISLFYERIEFYKNEIQIYYTSSVKDNFFKLKTFKYKDIDFINIDFATSKKSSKDIRIVYKIYLHLDLHSKNEKNKILVEDIFYIENKKVDIIRIINKFKSQNILIKIPKQKEEIFKLIKQNYTYEYDQSRIIKNLNEIFKLIE